jgi:hypothetical protein
MLVGRGAIIIWNDIAPQGRDEFYDWHINEHIPERLAVPGFQRGSRWIAATAETTPEFLTLYETDDPSIATSSPYLERLNAPTEWTRRATAHFRNTQRALTRVVHSTGSGRGGAIATLRFDGSAAGMAACATAARMVARRVDAPRPLRVSAFHFCLTDSIASGARTAESRDRPDIEDAPIGAILAEGCDVDAVADACRTFMTAAGIGMEGTTIGIYRLEHCR